MEAVRDCARHAASQLQTPGEAMGFCWQAETILQHAAHCQTAEEQVQAGTAVSAKLVELQSMDQRVAASLQLAEHWCFFASSARLGPPWEESAAVMELCLKIQKARSGVSPISSTLLDQLSLCIDKLTVGSDLYVSSQRQQVKQDVAGAVQLRATIVQQIPELTGQVASVLLASCNERSKSAPTTQQQTAQQHLAVGCAQQSLSKQAILACSMWISQIQSQDGTSSKMLTDLLSAADFLSRAAERYDVTQAAPPPSAQHIVGVPIHSSSAGAVPMPQPVASTPYVTGNPMYSQPRMQMPFPGGPGQAITAPPGMNTAYHAQPIQAAAIPAPPVHVPAAPPLHPVPQPTAPAQQPPAPVHSNALVATLLQASQTDGRAQQGVAGAAGTVAGGMPAVSSTPVTGSIVGIPVAQQPQPQPSNSASGSDPLLAMWNDLQG